MTLMELLQLFEDVDNGIAEVSLEDAKKLKEGLSDKVDSYYEVISRFESEEDRLKNEAKKIADAKKTVTKARDRVKDLLLHVMKAKDYTKLPGDKVTASIRTKKSFDVVREPSFEDLSEFEPAVRCSLSWDKRQMALLAETDERYKALITLKETEYVQFSHRKA